MANTNVGKGPGKKKGAVTVYRKEGPAPKKPKKSTVTTTIAAGKESSTYKPARTHTGDTRYGKEDPGKADPRFVEDARRNKQDVAFDKEGKPYRAGFTTKTSTPPKMNVSVQIGDQDLRPLVPHQAQSPKKSGKSSGKLKAMAMTYGTDSSKGGGTKYKNKVSAR